MASVIVHDLSSFNTGLLVVTALLIALVYLTVYLQRGKHMRKLADRIPGPPTLPIIGNMHLLATGDLHQGFKAFRDLSDYGTIARFWLGNLLFICISDPVAAERIIGNKKFLSRTEYGTKILRPFFKNGILISEGETWKLHRRMLAPHFGENIIRKYLSIFHRHATTLAERFQGFADGSSLFNIYENAFFCTMNSAWETTKGDTLSANFSENVEIPRHALRIGDIIAERFRRPWLIFDWIFNFTSMKKENDNISQYFQKLLQDFMDERVKKFDELDQRTHLENVIPLIDRLLMEGQMTNEEILVEMFNVLGAASETCATLFCYTMCMLGVYQDAQERLFQEQKNIFQDDPHREVSWEDLQKMTYTEQVVKEVLRLYPPFTVLFRTVEEDTYVGNGCVLPKGSNAVVFSFSLHRNPRYFPDPEKFDPDRFSAENSEGRHPYCYLPFGAGKRICVGHKYAMMMIMTMLSTTLRRYHVVNTVGGREAIDKSLELAQMMKPESGFNVQIAERDIT